MIQHKPRRTFKDCFKFGKKPSEINKLSDRLKEKLEILMVRLRIVDERIAEHDIFSRIATIHIEGTS